jgi:hypothetical protein
MTRSLSGALDFALSHLVFPLSFALLRRKSMVSEAKQYLAASKTRYECLLVGESNKSEEI